VSEVACILGTLNCVSNVCRKPADARGPRLRAVLLIVRTLRASHGRVLARLGARMHAKAEHYRKQADHCRKLAKSIRDADTKAHMLPNDLEAEGCRLDNEPTD
jgi:hypothetical protein